MTKSMQRGLALCLLGLTLSMTAHAAVRIKDLARFDGVRDNVAVGYGLVVGLAGTGDSQRSAATLQTVSNMLREFGLNVPPAGVASRNVAAVLVTANLPGFLRTGDRMDVNVSSIGDASSLSGGTLLVTPLLGVNRQIYATAQGALSVGGYKFEQNGTMRQKNHPTSGIISDGAIAEQTLTPVLVNTDGSLDLILNEPDFITSTRVASAINQRLTNVSATAIEAGRVKLQPISTGPTEIVAMVAAVEAIRVEPDEKARVVVNERTGTIVSGGNVSLSAATITQGDIRVAITQRFLVSQPQALILEADSGARTAIVPESTVDIHESEVQAVDLPQGATISELVTALRAIRVTTRDVIAIMQGLKRSGALHAELIIQ
jgi:flagellar P-ring protein precursor FlgI